MSGDKPKVFKSWRDLPPMAASFERMSVNDTGSWRNAEPLYINHTPPCTAKCPAGNDIAGFLKLASEGRFREAYELILETSPFPGICGRVCPHPCESECNRDTQGGRVNIHSIERFLAEVNADAPLPGKNLKYPDVKVAVIGSGPAGLSCAYHLARAGYPAQVFESYPLPGGMMRVGIPDYRLPKDVLDREIAALEAAGVEIATGVRVGNDIKFAALREKFAAVFIAVGFHRSRAMGIEGEDHPDVVAGVEILRRIALGENPKFKDKALVVGGGNTAMDAARSAARLGVEVTVVYRRSREEMPAISEEVEACLEEGVPIEFLTTPVKAHISGGRITEVECIRMRLGEPDSSGRRRPVPIEGSNFTIEAGQIITAIGEFPDLSFIDDKLKVESWGIPADEFGITNRPGVFAGGDAATGAGTVSHAIGSGRRAALAIESYLKGREIDRAMEILPPSLRRVDSKVVRVEDLNLEYFEFRPRIEASALRINEREGNFNEIHRVLSESEALYEAQRCFSCGACPSCDNCYVFCPDAAIQISAGEGQRYSIDLKHCKGCGVCAAECPRLCIEMKPVIG